MGLKDVGVRLVVEGTGKFKSQMKGVERQVGGIGAAIKKNRKAIGLGMTAIGGSILAMGGFAAKMFADFEAGMREVASLVNLSEDQFKAMSQGVRTLAADLGIDAVEATKALYQTISAGIPEGTALDFLEIASKAAIAGVTDTETAVDGLTTVINAFKIPLEDAQKVADIMFATVKGGKTTFEELSASMSLVAPIAATLGVSFEDVSGTVATLTKQGTPTSVAMTQIRAALIALTKPTKEMQALLDMLGFESGEAALQALGFAGTMQALTDAAEGNNQVLATAFGRVEGLNAALGVTGDNAATAAADLESMKTATEGAGAATEAFNVINKGASRQFAIMQAKIKDMGFAIGEVVIDAIKPLIDRIGQILKKLGDWIKENPKLFRTIVIVTGAVAGLMTVLGPLFLLLPPIITAFKFLKAVLSLTTIKMIALKLATLGMKVLLLPLKILMAGVTAAQWLWNAALLANPIGLIILGIVAFGAAMAALVVLVRRHWDNIVTFIRNSVNGVIDFLNRLIDGLNRVLGLVGITIPRIRRIGEPAKARKPVAAGPRTEAEREAEDIRKLRREKEEPLTKEKPLTIGEIIERSVRRSLEAATEPRVPLPGSPVSAPLLPHGVVGSGDTNITTYNIEATYTNPQDPATLALDLEALTLEATR